MKYRKKPVVVDAIQLKKTQISIREILEMMGQEVITKCNVASYKFYEYCNVIFDKGYMEIETLEGVMRANIGDYIIKGVNGEFYPCKPDIFEKTYEKVIENQFYYIASGCKLKKALTHLKICGNINIGDRKQILSVFSIL